MTTKLIYIGRDAFIEVPARDLTDEDFAERKERWAELGITEELLVKSGLYQPVTNVTPEGDIQPEPEQTTKKSGRKAAKDGE